MYPGGQASSHRSVGCESPIDCGDYAGFPGCGLLRLHSTYRHDLKIYASDEGRVQMTAAAFAKGMLALEGELTPILVQMVKSANMNGLLDSDSDPLTSCQQRVKARLHEIMQKNQNFTDDDYCKVGKGKKSMKDLQLYHSETLELMLQRWSKLERDFHTKNGRYDISKIPDIYDCIKYDVQHNGSLGLEHTLELFRLTRALADIIIPQEYGMKKEEKLEIAFAYCLPLVKKIQLDLQRTHEDESVNKLHPLYSRGVMSPGRHVRTRLYFTSESHVHSLLNIFRYGGLLDEQKDEQWKRAMDYLNAVSELNYMTQIVIMLYEDNNKDPSSEERFHVELHFSPGVRGCEDQDHAPLCSGFRPASAERKPDGCSPEDQSTEESDLASPFSEPIGIQKRSLIHAHKASDVEVLSDTPRGAAHRLFTSCSRQSPEARQSSAELFSVPAVKRFSVSYANHPTNGFEGCSLVPSIYPLETLHNSLSLKQVDEFLSSVCENDGDSRANRALSAIFNSQTQLPVEDHIPQLVLSRPLSYSPAQRTHAVVNTTASPNQSAALPVCD
ncbi:hypothetical protein GJAV_G00234930 [Gymnothorax javanicus]|nr:hypothetical protein GJAV_G00234930 [Gymnothorax javanicus]